MPSLIFDFKWYKDSKGYRLVSAPRLKAGQNIVDRAAADIQPARIVRNGGRLAPCQPMKIEKLFERFSRLTTAEQILKFVETYGPLTAQGLRGKGDVVLDVLDEAEHMRRGVSKALGKLNVAIDTLHGETRLTVSPASLLDAIWLQFAQANVPSRECPQCNKRFLFGAAAGLRKDAKFCSSDCQKRYNSLKRSRR
ncbi:hypothetical protein [Nitrobacter sp.]|jgi:hypothetical protein|uniref:hypothetical protein n=1 Tax=Nitrobacter sp. TaxID=29420 RepID=UPI003F6544D3